MSDKTPTFFILGYPRSGTTWFANLFNSHPEVVYRHEMMGRCYGDFPAELFNKLKYDYSLSDSDYETVINIILSPNIESDRAPFFGKNHLLLNSPKLHYLFWIASKAVPLLQPIYKHLFFPAGKKLTLVIKETRSALNMDSILEAVRSDKNLILFRHPCGAVASSLRGIKMGKMPPSSTEQRIEWANEEKTGKFLTELELTSSDISSLPEYEYLAMRWRLQNEDYLTIGDNSKKNIYISYEDFMLNQESNIKQLFEKLNLSFNASVQSFLKVSSGGSNNKPLLKDSSSSYYSVYKSSGVNPEKWKKDLSQDEINGIEKYTLDTYKTLLTLS
jgi:hypothetical protein